MNAQETLNQLREKRRDVFITEENAQQYGKIVTATGQIIDLNPIAYDFYFKMLFEVRTRNSDRYDSDTLKVIDK